MAVYLLNEEIVFPDPRLADSDGLLAVGGDLSAERLLLAYSNGIFPWYNPGEEIMWWAPDPRFVLFTEDFKTTKSYRSLIRNHNFAISFNQAFPKVIKACKTRKRQGQPGTWITEAMRKAYITLHNKGFAVSVEVWDNDLLVAGLYGVITRHVFCGESMFHTVNNAGKVAVYHLVELCKIGKIKLIDVQMHSVFFEQIGAAYIPLSEYLHILQDEL
ncbi:MAG: leucyl/phenylalanyl-tRNA--protein transferase [Bacteroidales bacterium]|nr:leucyl/phenylalanyl-tRNA--protein transferase [Bacteroidales bacterium]HOY39672.1 leucyl/phenylalanyl-tRNA--protein transferase [Bacteroidales bacterium]HQP05216.1 leucyl/phenylalanyl-tRNA--protein transferase [Bacteroidales bacterium]